MHPRLTVGAYRAGARVAHILPGTLATTAARAVGAAVPCLLRRKARLAASHQRRILGPQLAGAALRAHVRRCFSSYAQYWVDSFRLTHLRPDEIAARLDPEGVEHVEAGLAAGNGVIMAMPHLGSWDLGGAWFSSLFPLTVVAEALEPPALFDWFVSHRSRLGMEVVALGPGAAPLLLKALKANRVLGLLCDRDIEGGGIEVDFFGERTTMPAGPATLSLRTGAPILPNAAVYTPDGRVRGIIRPPIVFERTGNGLRKDVEALTQLVADELASLIRSFPDQWHVLQPTWPSDAGYRLDAAGQPRRAHRSP